MNGLLGSSSVSRKVTAAVVVAVGLGCAALMSLSYERMKSALYHHSVEDQTFTGQMLASNAAGAIRWNKPEQVERAFATLMHDDTSELDVMIAMTLDGEVVTRFQREGRADAGDLAGALRQESGTIDSGETVTRVDAQHVVVLAPALDAKDGTVVGRVAVAFNLDALNAEITSLATIQALTTVVTMVSVILVVYFVLRSVVVRPLARMNELLAEVSSGDGDLTRRVEVGANDEIGRLAGHVNTFISNLQDSVSGVLEASGAVAASAGRSRELSAEVNHTLGTHQQRLEEVATAMNEMSATVAEVAR
ncbi:MAG: methyl-accepting chemotaxis protein, partial [Planctomycetes bacterium]|nr:methyl-accepting chemotaxis protein [Planctomycetota bacterium]